MEKELAMVVKDLVSCEFTVKDQERIPVLNLLSLEIGKGDIFGLSASRKRGVNYSCSNSRQYASLFKRNG